MLAAWTFNTVPRGQLCCCAIPKAMLTRDLFCRSEAQSGGYTEDVTAGGDDFSTEQSQPATSQQVRAKLPAGLLCELF